MASREIPIHAFQRDDSSSIPLKLEILEHRNNYDTSIPHRHNYYEIFFFEKGGGVHMVDFEELDIQNRSVHFVSPGQVHHVRRALDSNGYVIMFSRDFFYFNLEHKDILEEMPFLNNKTSKPLISLEAGLYDEFLQLFNYFKKEYFGENSLKKDILRSYLNIMLLKCKSRFEETAIPDESPDNAARQLVNNFRNLLEQNFTEIHLVNDYANQLNVTPNYLNDTTKKVIGKTASELIQNRVALEAKRLLLHSSLTNKEIAYFLHFSDPSYFSRFFKKHTGLSPNDFKKNVD